MQLKHIATHTAVLSALTPALSIGGDFLAKLNPLSLNILSAILITLLFKYFPLTDLPKNINTDTTEM